ncbi:MAG: DUF1844 domain-containing protein [Armatimonadetes bacterium]|nr:DUF1844 domain-containing protein [Armatimonadota bacterium]
MADQTEKEPIDFFQVLMMMLEQSASIAWQKLGLQPDLITGTIHADFAQAKVAIDVTVDLAKHLEGKLDESDRREVQNLIRDLRLNYVQKSGGQS